MLLKLIGTLSEIVLEGVKAWSEERRTRFIDEYHDILRLIDNAENRPPGSYTDADLDLLRERLETFLKAYSGELKRHNTETGN